MLKSVLFLNNFGVGFIRFSVTFAPWNRWNKIGYVIGFRDELSAQALITTLFQKHKPEGYFSLICAKYCKYLSCLRPAIYCISSAMTGIPFGFGCLCRIRLQVYTVIKRSAIDIKTLPILILRAGLTQRIPNKSTPFDSTRPLYGANQNNILVRTKSTGELPSIELE